MAICLQCGRPGFDTWVRKIPWRRESYPLQYSILENSMDCLVHGVARVGHHWVSFTFMAFEFNSVQSLNCVWLFATPELQHARPPCPSPTPGVYPNSNPLSQWCHPTISFSVVPFSSCLQCCPASGSFPMSQFFTSGDQGKQLFNTLRRQRHEVGY